MDLHKEFGRIKGGVFGPLSLHEQAVSGRKVPQMKRLRKVRDEGRRVFAIALLNEDEATEPFLVGTPPTNIKEAAPRVVRHGVRRSVGHATGDAK